MDIKDITSKKHEKLTKEELLEMKKLMIQSGEWAKKTICMTYFYISFIAIIWGFWIIYWSYRATMKILGSDFNPKVILYNICWSTVIYGVGFLMFIKIPGEIKSIRTLKYKYAKSRFFAKEIDMLLHAMKRFAEAHKEHQQVIKQCNDKLNGSNE